MDRIRAAGNRSADWILLENPRVRRISILPNPSRGVKLKPSREARDAAMPARCSYLSAGMSQCYRWLIETDPGAFRSDNPFYYLKLVLCAHIYALLVDYNVHN